MKIRLTYKGDLKDTERFLDKAINLNSKIYNILEKYAKEGVKNLSAATPVDTGYTASVWSYEIHMEQGHYIIRWNNANVVKGVPIAIILQYGHGTRNGGYVQGRDYINPALQPIFDKLADDLWKEVTSK